MKKILPILFITGLATACSHHHPPAQVIDGHVTASGISGYHRVAKGETLYSIAWAYGMDFHTLADMNCLDKPYVIHTGQILRLRGQVPCAGKKVIGTSHVRPLAVKYEKSAPAFVPAITPENEKIKIVPQPVISSSSQTLTGPAAQPKPVTSNQSISESNTKKPTVTIKEQALPALKGWLWPVKGPLLQTFDGSRYANNGLDIGGQLDTPIHAARGGEIVYAGSGLKGYGQLIIIKHSEDTLSAYAHNHALLVHEGQMVKAGQTIAKMGYSGTNRVKLHFEIRVHGQAVNPLNFLPH